MTILIKKIDVRRKNAFKVTIDINSSMIKTKKNINFGFQSW